MEMSYTNYTSWGYAERCWRFGVGALWFDRYGCGFDVRLWGYGWLLSVDVRQESMVWFRCGQDTWR